MLFALQFLHLQNGYSNKILPYPPAGIAVKVTIENICGRIYKPSSGYYYCLIQDIDPL